MLNDLMTVLQKDLPVRLYNTIQKNYDDNHQLCSIFLRHDNDKLLSQFTVWSDLSVMQEIFDIENEEYIKYERLNISTVYEVKRVFDDFLTLII